MINKSPPSSPHACNYFKVNFENIIILFIIIYRRLIIYASRFNQLEAIGRIRIWLIGKAIIAQVGVWSCLLN